MACFPSFFPITAEHPPTDRYPHPLRCSVCHPGLRFSVMGAGAVGCYFGALLARAGMPLRSSGGRRMWRRCKSTACGCRLPCWMCRCPWRPQHRGQRGAWRRRGAVLREVVRFGRRCTADSPPSGPRCAGADFAERRGQRRARARAVLHASTPVAAAVVYVAAMGGPGHVVHHGRGELVIAPSPRSDEVARQLTAAGIPTQVSDNVRGALWAKLVLNSAYNALSALSQQPYGPLVRRRDAGDCRHRGRVPGRGGC